MEIKNKKGKIIFSGNIADLRRANLIGADLRGADLIGADLMRADLREANLSGADLREADLSGANLIGANLSDADLRGANLSDADLRRANLIGADLRGADLIGAYLRGADLENIMINETTSGIALACPEEGSFIAYKKCIDEVIVKLLIPDDAKRSSATTLKCRASKAIVLEISGGLDVAKSKHDPSFVYKVGEIVSVNDFDENRWNECSTGIHFFTSRMLAKQY